MGGNQEWNDVRSCDCPRWQQPPKVAAALGFDGPIDDRVFWVPFVAFAAIFTAVALDPKSMRTARGAHALYETEDITATATSPCKKEEPWTDPENIHSDEDVIG